MPQKSNSNIVLTEMIQSKIYIIRGQKVMLDRDLAMLYQVTTKALNQAVKRNMKRFPSDFMFQLKDDEATNLKSQNVTSSWGGSRRANPHAFTELGVAMLSSVLNSDRAIEVNIQIMRVFTKLREMIMSHKDLARKINELEKKYDSQFIAVFNAIRQLMSAPSDGYKRTKVGFVVDK